MTDSISKLNNLNYKAKKYFRFAIGNDFPDDFNKMDSAIKKNINNPKLDIKSYRFKEAHHDTTPGLLISNALYEIFENWYSAQSKYSSVKQNELSIKTSLEQEILPNYGMNLNFSLGILNGKGWHFYNEKQYDKAIQAWQILMDTYPNFSEGYLNIINAQIKSNKSYLKTAEHFKKSLSESEFYTEKQKKDLEEEIKEIIK